jgi:hypothetical protein
MGVHPRCAFGSQRYPRWVRLVTNAGTFARASSCLIVRERSPAPLAPKLKLGVAMVGERWIGCLLRFLFLGALVGVGGCASVEYRVPTWEVQRLTQLPPAMRGGEVRVVPSNAVVPPPPALVAEAPPPPDVDVDVDVEIPVVVAPGPVVVAPRPVVFPRQVGATVGVGTRAAPPAGGGWKGGPPRNAGRWSPAPAPSRPTPAAFGRSSGGHHGGHGGGGGAGAAAGAVAAVALIAILADVAVTAAEADAASRYDGWVAVDVNHPLHLFYKGGLGRVVPLAQLGPADLIGLQNAVLVEDDGHVEPLRQAPLPTAGPPPAPVPPPAPAAVAWAAPGATSTPSAAAPTAPPAVATPPPAPVSQVSDPETP